MNKCDLEDQLPALTSRRQKQNNYAFMLHELDKGDRPGAWGKTARFGALKPAIAFHIKHNT
ncbi:unnamed protein product [Clonostachys solani]|uniref:Uncharacterized protein n=1 Tax=Clonostachys solani TaxID=160281 RepID=A0A9N9Z1C1_9HYPO|nr:unnamed protein product [Clonostachys solani]